MEGLLREKGVDEAALALVIDQLHEDGALDDERFAIRYAEDKRELAGWGPERIRKALKERGLPDDLIDPALAAESRDDQLQRAVDFLASKDLAVEGPEERRKALGALARRGFESEVSYEAMREHERTRRDGGGNG
jgi:regulatory protein